MSPGLEGKGCVGSQILHAVVQKDTHTSKFRSAFQHVALSRRKGGHGLHVLLPAVLTLQHGMWQIVLALCVLQGAGQELGSSETSNGTDAVGWKFAEFCIPNVSHALRLIDSLEKNTMCMDIQRREASTLWCGGPLRKHRAFGGVLRTIWSGRQLWCREWLDTGSLDTALCLKAWALFLSPSATAKFSEVLSVCSALAAFSSLQLCRCCEPVWPTSSDGS